MMHLTADTKRFSGLLLAMLVLSVFILPVCALTPSAAMAMPVEGESVPCGSEGTVMEACPIGKPVSATPSAAPVTDIQALNFTSVEPVAPIATGYSLIRTDVPAHESPPAHLTPLRI